MNSPDEVPKLKPWFFLAGDVALLATAYFIATSSKAPLVGGPLLAVVACVGFGAVLAVFPFVVTYTRRHELELFERQNEIAALAQTTANSAEQLSIAVASLHGISETAAKNLRVAEQLPQKLQEKVNEFKVQLNEVSVTDNEALAQEVNTLRSTETERLESALAAIRKTAAELVALENSSREQIVQIGQTLSRFSAEATRAAQESVAATTRASAEAEKSLSAKEAVVAQAIDKAIASALAQLEEKIARISDDLCTKLSDSTKQLGVVQPTFSSSRDSDSEREKQVSTYTQTEEAPATTAGVSPKGIPAEAPAAETVDELRPIARKRPAKKPQSEPDELGLGLDAPSAATELLTSASPAEMMKEPNEAPDGTTRLLVTAYIGIGNKLYARGEGPGLQWDKGVPLQFVSIGKWRWETTEASAPVTLKLYKNDELECSSLGVVTLEPKYQQEVTATF